MHICTNTHPPTPTPSFNSPCTGLERGSVAGRRREAARQVLLPGNSGPLVVPLSVSPHSSTPPSTTPSCTFIHFISYRFTPHPTPSSSHTGVSLIPHILLVDSHHFIIFFFFTLCLCYIHIKKQSNQRLISIHGCRDMSHPKTCNLCVIQPVLECQLRRLSSQPRYSDYHRLAACLEGWDTTKTDGSHSF